MEKNRKNEWPNGPNVFKNVGVSYSAADVNVWAGFYINYFNLVGTGKTKFLSQSDNRWLW